MKKKILLIFFIFAKIKSDCDFVIFSYNRPLQLFALLESMQKYVVNANNITVIYRADDIYVNAYKRIIKSFPSFIFLKQNKINPEEDFKNLVMKATFESPSEYVCFGVDDIIIKDYLNISLCINYLKKTNAYGFFLRLGKNINYSYMIGQQTFPPKSELIGESIYIYRFADGSGDWSYPNNLDMTIYKKKDIYNDYLLLNCKKPNYEGEWALKADLSKYGLFFEESKIVNIPINTCENTANRNMHLYTNEELLLKFKQNLKININNFYKIKNNSAHYECIPEFIRK